MNKKIIIPFVAFISFALFSCVKDQVEERRVPTIDGEQIEMPVSFRVDDYQGDPEPVIEELTKAPLSGINEGSSITDVWLFQFDGTTDGSVLISPPLYVSGTGLAQAVPFIQSTATHMIVAVANTSNAAFEWRMTPGITTYSQMKTRYTDLMFEKEGYAYSKLILSGVFTGVVNGSANIVFPLKRIVAKIAFGIKNNAGSGLTVRSVQLYNIPTKLELLSNEIAMAANALYPMFSDVENSYIDYPASVVSLAPGSALSNFVWYMPQNRQTGTPGTNSDPGLKNRLARPRATYVKIIASNAAGDNYVYRIYLGANMTNNFDILPNTRYVSTVTINGPGDPNIDERVTKNDIVDTRGKAANSYMLNPPEVVGNSRTYLIYPTQVNRYFNTVSGYEPSAAAYIGAVATNDAVRWAARVIWMDQPNLITVTSNPNGTNDGKINLVVDPDAKGEDMPFKVIVPAGTQSCNFTVGIFNNIDGNGIQNPLTEPFTWSYHLWVTDYNPDVKVVISANQYVYAAKNGAVHRYEDRSGYSFWNNTCENGVIMDRSIGALSDRQEITPRSRGLLYYQFGRKDPFPSYNCPVYVPAAPGVTPGQVSIESQVSGPGTGVSILNSLAEPLTYFTGIVSSGNRDWADEEEAPVRLWKDKMITSTNFDLTSTSLKSIFDPCPHGWQLPTYSVWSDFVYSSNSNTNPYITGTIMNGERGLEWWRDGYMGMRYWPGTGMAEEEILYQAGGYFYGDSPTSIGTSNFIYSGYVWTSYPSGANNGYFINYTPYYLNNFTITSRLNGFQVRCMKFVAN